MVKVTLTHPIIGDKEFDADHAQRILDMKPNGGWKLKETETKGDDANGAGNTKKAEGRERKPRPTK